MALVDYRNRVNSTLLLPDSRLQVTRTADVINSAAFTADALRAEVFLPWGTPCDKFPTALLVKQNLLGQHPAGQGQRGDPTVSPERHPAILEQVYEEMSPSQETPVGNADVSIAQDGLITVKQDWIQLSTGTAIYGNVGVDVALPPWSQCVLKDQVDTDDGTLRTIKRTYISFGTISESEEIKNEGALLIKSITSVGTVPATPAGYTLIETKEENPNGLSVFTYRFAYGHGVIDIREQQRDGGLRLVTWVSLGDVYDASYMLPPGILVLKDAEALDGTYRFTVACMQSATGGDPTTGAALSYFDKHPFRYPGRAKAYITSGTSVYTITDGMSQTPYPFAAKLYDVYLSPPVDVELDAEVVVSYQTSAALTLGTSFWNPDSWATIEAKFQQNNSVAAIHDVRSLAGFRAINAGTAINFFAATVTISTPGGTVWVTNFAYSCLGQSLYPMSNGSLVVYGGPVDPGGLNWVLAAKLEPAFVSLDGVQYFRKTQVSAFVPPQPTLPV